MNCISDAILLGGGFWGGFLFVCLFVCCWFSFCFWFLSFSFVFLFVLNTKTVSTHLFVLLSSDNIGIKFTK